MSADFTLRIEVAPIEIRIRSFLDIGIVRAISELKELIMASNAELATRLEALAARADKAKAEITKAIQDLRDVIAAGGDVPPEVEAALVKAETAVGGLDDMNPDA